MNKRVVKLFRGLEGFLSKGISTTKLGKRHNNFLYDFLTTHNDIKFSVSK